MFLRASCLAALALATILCAILTTPAQAGEKARSVENDNLAVSLDDQTGMLTILDKRANVRWIQFSEQRQIRTEKPKEILKIKKADGKVAVDGSMTEWDNVPPITLTRDMATDLKNITDDRDLRALAYLMWDENTLYLAAKITDDKLVFRDTGRPDPELLKWWERDSIEFWVGDKQIGFVVNPQKSIVTTAGGELSGCDVVVKTVEGGYVLEAAVPLKHLPDLAGKAEVGRRIAFAVGVNDADATGSREAQIYFPRSWQHSRVETFADAVLADAKGEVSKEQAEKAQEPEAAIRNITAIDKPHSGLSFETDLDLGKGVKMPASVRVMLPKDTSDVWVEVEGPKDTEMSSVAYPMPFMPEQGESWMAISPYADGLLLQLRANALPKDTRGNPKTWWGCDMAFFGITNIEAGYGYDCIFDTPDDVRINMRATSKDADAKMTVGPAWQSSMGRWSYTRRAIYRFCPTGGYVALAKGYREYAREKGLLKTLREKMKRRPEIAKLMGAPDIWGAPGLKFCQEAKAAGMDRMLVNGTWGVKNTEEIKKLGYLVSVYDNYEDIMAGKGNQYGDCKVPEDSPLMADGKRMLGWPVHETDPKTGRTKMDPKTGKPFIKEQFGKRCSVLDLPAAKRWIPMDQEKNPRNARFLDVTTATGLRECYDPNHYCTRSVDREARQRLANYVSEDLGLVLGGEHGTWWGEPYYDYWEGMQSGGFYSWPAGHVGMDLPKSRDEIGADYLTYGIGHYYRIPFWELVFGDCVVSYWYWGDSTGHLYNVAPDISYKQDLFNMLYGNPPMYWVSQPYSFNWGKPELRERLLESYRNTCKLHEQIGFDEMLSHTWLTEDRTVQKTTFSSGTIVVVNFGEKTYELKDEDATYPLSPLGFFARGPAIHQFRIKKDNRDITYIKTPDYLFADASGTPCDFGALATAGPVTVRTLEGGRLKVTRTKEGPATLVRPARIVPKWDLESTHVLALDDTGGRLREIAFEAKDGDTVQLAGVGAFEIVCGPEFNLPSLSIDGLSISVGQEPIKQGDKVTIEAVVQNRGRVRAENVAVAFYLDQRTPAGPVGTQQVSVDGGGGAKVSCPLDTANLDGVRKIIIAVDPDNRIAELIETDNVAEKTVTITPDYARWHYRLCAEVANGEAEQEDAIVVLPVDLGAEMRRLGGSGALDTGSIRVCERTADGGPGRPLPCQFDKAKDFDAKGNAKGEVVWQMPGKVAAGAKAQCLIFFDTVENGEKKGSGATIWDAENTTASTEGYTAVFREGCIVELYDKLGSDKDKSFLTGLVYSSSQTGWTREENSTVEETTVVADGPLRAVVRIAKQLGGGLNYEKTYTFYPRRMDVHFKANKSYGNISRAYYGLEGTYEDPLGHKAKVDGQGNAEEVAGKCPNPKYYVVYAPGWAHSCVALSKFDNITYWDGGSWGGIGLSGGDIAGAEMSYVMHPGQKDGAFGKVDCDRLTHPLQARIVP